ncbi:hypothetical protein [Polluticaenibacter yanchengensis]|uniref:Bacteroidetes PKD-like domain-containing protein n=1 Tax=Polluticaenibacter yanchengensis TaxID=3014562 RepID=A0ABT4UEM3_9BACT|nr:hypothetical protein [Chitinophagaceae bacterium LY-5]
MKFRILLFLANVFLLTSCFEKDNDDKQCADFKKIKIVPDQASYKVGETMELNLEGPIDGTSINWYYSKEAFRLGTGGYYKETYLTKDHQGWYYVNVHSPYCQDYVLDSVFIKIEDSETVSCNIKNNSVEFSSLSDISNGTVSFGKDASLGSNHFSIGQWGGPDLKLYLHPSWNSNPIEEGKYQIVTYSGLTSASSRYSVAITTISQSVYYVAYEGSVFISKNASGKLVAKFCNVKMQGEWGNRTFTTTASGTLVQP